MLKRKNPFKNVVKKVELHTWRTQSSGVHSPEPIRVMWVCQSTLPWSCITHFSAQSPLLGSDVGSGQSVSQFHSLLMSCRQTLFLLNIGVPLKKKMADWKWLEWTSLKFRPFKIQRSKKTRNLREMGILHRRVRENSHI